MNFKFDNFFDIIFSEPPKVKKSEFEPTNFDNRRTRNSSSTADKTKERLKSVGKQFKKSSSASVFSKLRPKFSKYDISGPVIESD